MAKKDTPAVQSEYQNNPFFVAIDGLKLFFGLALPVALFACLFAFFGSFTSIFSPNSTEKNAFTNAETFEQLRDEARRSVDTTVSGFASLSGEQWATYIGIGLVALAIVVYLATTIAGIFAVTSARLSRGEKTTFIDAFNASQTRFFGFLWLQILTAIKIIGWSLLFIIPGIIMAVRYSLAGAAFFDKDLSANQALKHSAHLTKGAWLTTNASFYLLRFITLGLINDILTPGTQAILYRQFSAYDTAGLKKPAAHPLSWFTLFIPMTMLLAVALLIGLAIWVFYSF